MTHQMLFRIRILVLYGSFLLLTLAAAGQDLRGRCVGVQRGDALEAEIGPRRVTIRLAGIAAPEPAQPFGAAARQALAGLALDREIVARPLLRDPSGAIHAVVFAAPDSTASLNVALVRAGWAWSDPASNLVKGLDDAQQLARAAGAGLWRDPAAMAPWEWRTLPAGRRPAARFTPEGKAVQPQAKPTPAATQLFVSRNAPEDDALLRNVIAASRRAQPRLDDVSKRMLIAGYRQGGARGMPAGGATRRLGGSSYDDAPFANESYFPQQSTRQLGNVMTIRSGFSTPPNGMGPGFVLGR